MYTKANLAALRVKKDIAEVRHKYELCCLYSSEREGGEDSQNYENGGPCERALHVVDGFTFTMRGQGC